MNWPGTSLEANWKWRLPGESLSIDRDVVEYMRDLNERTQRGTYARHPVRRPTTPPAASGNGMHV